MIINQVNPNYYIRFPNGSVIVRSANAPSFIDAKSIIYEKPAMDVNYQHIYRATGNVIIKDAGTGVVRRLKEGRYNQNGYIKGSLLIENGVVLSTVEGSSVDFSIEGEITNKGVVKNYSDEYLALTLSNYSVSGNLINSLSFDKRDFSTIYGRIIVCANEPLNLDYSEMSFLYRICDSKNENENLISINKETYLKAYGYSLTIFDVNSILKIDQYERAGSFNISANAKVILNNVKSTVSATGNGVLEINNKCYNCRINHPNGTVVIDEANQDWNYINAGNIVYK